MDALKYWAQTQGTALLSTVLKAVIIAVIGILISYHHAHHQQGFGEIQV